VFNYHQRYRRSVESLGWNLLNVAQSEIGSNRKHRGNRFLTVIQYCLDMTQVLLELRRVCRDGARIIMVVGRESSVRKTSFFNGRIMAALGVRCAGLQLVTRQERVFNNRFGLAIYEDILHLVVDQQQNGVRADPASIAEAILRNAESRAPSESRRDLRLALAELPNVRPSVVFQPAAANHAPHRRLRVAT
jgi:hypothetical protein